MKPKQLLKLSISTLLAFVICILLTSFDRDLNQLPEQIAKAISITNLLAFVYAIIGLFILFLAVLSIRKNKDGK